MSKKKKKVKKKEVEWLEPLSLKGYKGEHAIYTGTIVITHPIEK